MVFTLSVGNFGIKCNSMDDVHHLINSVREYFKCSIDWEGQKYIGLTLDFNYSKKYVDISMTGYIPNAFHTFQHKPPERPQDAPHPCNEPVYGK